MNFTLLDNLKLKMRVSIIIVIMVTFTMVLISLLVYFTRKSGTFKVTEDCISAQLKDLSELVAVSYDFNLERNINKTPEEILAEKKYYDNGFAFLIDNKGNWIAKPPARFSNYFSNQSMSRIISQNEKIIITDGEFGKCWVFSTQTNSHITGIAVFEKDFWHPTRKLTYLLIVIGISGGIIIFTILLHFIMQPITRHLSNLAKQINRLSLGIFPEKIIIPRKDEIGDIAESVNNLIAGLRKTADFAAEIGKGNYDYEYTPLSQDDVLGNSLLDTRENLKNAANENAKRKIEEEERNWATTGLAEFSDILRLDYKNIEDLGFKIIQKLIKYLDINQGGLFIVNDENQSQKFLEMVACYAFDRQKFVELKINPGEGLVGACFLERKTTHIKKVPDSYIRITSGLGEANPTSLLLVPLVLNEEIFGVIELASFKIFPKYKIDFVEKVAESIASAISNAKTNAKTQKLLHQSQLQAEQMILQEKEMKQNLEEMQATQEEMQRLLTLNNLRIEQAQAISNVREICSNSSISIKDAFENIAKIMINGWQFTNYAAARIKYKNTVVESHGFMDTTWKLSEEIEISKGNSALIEVIYIKEFPNADKGPFLREEIDLIKNIAAVIKGFLLSKQ
ncbi:MAG: GAF domain-containing protein [Bacteroidetes bacterium]|nr:GAF domain-containing protein [Bacteroidota bacterium]